MHTTKRWRFALLTLVLAISAQAAPVGRLYVFGDSYSDLGAGYVDCDGPTAVAYLAWNLGLEFTHAKAPKAANKGLDFAVSGARTGEGAGRVVKDQLLGYGMANPVRDFATRVQAGEIHFDPETTLFFIAGGLNDGALATEITVWNLRQEIETLKGLGARHFTVALLPTRIPNFSAVGIRLNPALTQLVKDAGDQLGVDIWINHWGGYFDEVMDHPGDHGITNTTSRCAGRSIFDEDTTPVGDPATFYYYHDGHPSTAVHRIVGKMLAVEVATRVGPPAAGTPKP